MIKITFIWNTSNFVGDVRVSVLFTALTISIFYENFECVVARAFYAISPLVIRMGVRATKLASTVKHQNLKIVVAFIGDAGSTA